MLSAWLIAWLLGIAGLAGLIAISMSLSTYRRLARDGAPAPGRILLNLWLTPLTWFLASGASGHEAGLVGRKAWVSWDLRWGPSGQSSAIVQGGDEHHLRLLLLTPVKVSVGPTGDLVDVTDVRFKASGKPNYPWGTASGVLEPVSLSPEHADPLQYPRARVCVL